MGTLKALLPWAGVTLLEYQVAQLLASRCSEVVVVLGHEAERLRRVLGASTRRPNPPSPFPAGEGGAHHNSLTVVFNPDYRLGKTTSIRVGVAALSPEATAALVLAVDQPRPAWLLDQLVAEREQTGGAVVLPAHAGRRGHPPVFGASLFPELLALSEEREGLREVMQRHAAEILAVDVASPIVHANLNTPEDHAAALHLCGGAR
jgi:molybdenum cofactor cytidylyltransferase